MRWQGRYVEIVVLDTQDLVNFFIDIKMPGMRAEASRLVVGVNQGDASVIAQAVQAAVAPSAGQQALQAGEAVPSLGIPGVDMDLRTNETHKQYTRKSQKDSFRLYKITK